MARLKSRKRAGAIPPFFRTLRLTISPMQEFIFLFYLFPLATPEKRFNFPPSPKKSATRKETVSLF